MYKRLFRLDLYNNFVLFLLGK